MNESKIKIFAFYHKPMPVVVDDGVNCPLMVGRGADGFLCDNTGDNISAMNPHYCELTGIYWLWKNIDDCDIIGTCHYRRYYTARPEPLLYRLKRLTYWPTRLYGKRYGLIYTNNLALFRPRILSGPEIEQIFEMYDAILPTPRRLRYSVATHYCRYHSARELTLLEDVIREQCPDYMPEFEQVMNSNRLYANNMFVLRREQFRQYAEWLFPLLFAIEKRIDFQTLTGYQTRVMGFIAERLLNVWFARQQLNVAELPLIYFKKIKI
ncbi:MAG: DUF4422 domain-containing protein [Bacteroidales bacterium]|jgi:hypothetical protein|nr:DUF4422 domain-containing protein [Bacteroidales bacterium]